MGFSQFALAQGEDELSTGLGMVAVDISAADPSTEQIDQINAALISAPSRRAEYLKTVNYFRAQQEGILANFERQLLEGASDSERSVIFEDTNMINNATDSTINSLNERYGIAGKAITISNPPNWQPVPQPGPSDGCKNKDWFDERTGSFEHFEHIEGLDKPCVLTVSSRRVLGSMKHGLNDELTANFYRSITDLSLSIVAIRKGKPVVTSKQSDSYFAVIYGATKELDHNTSYTAIDIGASHFGTTIQTRRENCPEAEFFYSKFNTAVTYQANSQPDVLKQRLAVSGGGLEEFTDDMTHCDAALLGRDAVYPFLRNSLCLVHSNINNGQITVEPWQGISYPHLHVTTCQGESECPTKPAKEIPMIAQCAGFGPDSPQM